MARAQLTPVVFKDIGDTTAMKHIAGAFTKIDTDGFYIKTGGSSHRDASRMIFLTARTTKSTGVGYIYIRGGSTAGNDDYEPGRYSTGRDFRLTVATSSKSSQGMNINISGMISNTARFKDSNGYINIDFSTKLSTAASATVACFIAAMWLQK